MLAVKDNQPHLADSIRDFFTQFQAVPERTPHTAAETLEKDHGRIEVRRCFAFDQFDCLAKPEQWADLRIGNSTTFPEVFQHLPPIVNRNFPPGSSDLSWNPCLFP